MSELYMYPDLPPLIHICENCGLEKVMTPKEAFDEGWDYPPVFFPFKTLSPRTCGNCAISTTLWWRFTNEGDKYQFTDQDKILIERIYGEPESITPKESDETQERS